MWSLWDQFKIPMGFPGGPVVKNPSASAGAMGSSPNLGRSHMLQGNETRAAQLLSLCSTTREATAARRLRAATRERLHAATKPQHGHK